MILRRGDETIILTNEIQIAAYKNSGFTEVKPTAPKRGGKNGAGKTDRGAKEA